MEDKDLETCLRASRGSVIPASLFIISLFLFLAFFFMAMEGADRGAMLPVVSLATVLMIIAHGKTNGLLYPGVHPWRSLRNRL